MIRQTGGLASGATSTRSSASFWAVSRASWIGRIPSWAPSGLITLTSLIRIRSFTRTLLLMDAPSFMLSRPISLHGRLEFLFDCGDESIGRHDSQITPAALSHRDGARCHLFLSYYQGVGDLLHLSIPNLMADLLVPHVHFRAHPCSPEPVRD